MKKTNGDGWYIKYLPTAQFNHRCTWDKKDIGTDFVLFPENCFLKGVVTRLCVVIEDYSFDTKILPRFLEIYGEL